MLAYFVFILSKKKIQMGHLFLTKYLWFSPLVSLVIFTYKDYSDNASQYHSIDHGIYLDCLRKACQYNQEKMNELSKHASLQIINTSKGP